LEHGEEVPGVADALVELALAQLGGRDVLADGEVDRDQPAQAALHAPGAAVGARGRAHLGS
jgi:hypothetical protein